MKLLKLRMMVKWEPIGSQPEDEWVLISIPLKSTLECHGGHVIMARWVTQDEYYDYCEDTKDMMWLDTDGEPVPFHPSHWMELPPPAATGDD